MTSPAGSHGQGTPCIGILGSGQLVRMIAIAIPGARSAGLMAAQILALGAAALVSRLHSWRQAQTDSVADSPS